ncbi:unnamed protein product [Kuraishia capsulata CBS 1993]|uniref:mRNA cap guanine-N(7) methyltransferase n=1 Tax=Kuraishia capsulata CBS 1993 TaxID=1382522 RepID=W6MHS9_9ASCO|nr:uncharacterized protein KUCA_T00001317001 [Kuraishia capsulata CBS 1993]CDK25348.1 unnamed protein product [Kuraishia capsulata CBS 1993]
MLDSVSISDVVLFCHCAPLCFLYTMTDIPQPIDSSNKERVFEDSHKRRKVQRPKPARVGGAGGAFSLRGRDESQANTQTVSKPEIAASKAVPSSLGLSASTTASSAVPVAVPTQKPAWMSDEEFAKHNQNLQAAAGPTVDETKKLRKPKRRGNMEDQLRRAAEERQREDQKEQRQVKETMITYQAGQVDDMIKSHYNQRTNLSKREKRSASPIYKLRNFNNCIKYMLIYMFSKPGDNVLDLGCGKGGDLQKWHQSKIGHYTGIDLSDDSIKEAIRRYRTMQHLSSFGVVFVAGDAFKTAIPDVIKGFESEVSFPFDMVSMQFCMHYGFDSEETARSMIKNVSKSLRRGGKFIGTIPSSDFMKTKLKDLPAGEKGWGNSLYRVNFDQDPPRDGIFRPAYGQLYTYYLVDAVDNVPEFVVPFEAFRALCEEYNLELRYKKQFFDMFAEEIPNWIKRLNPRLLEGMRRADGTYGVEGEEKEAAAFYLAFCFEKTGYE